MVDWGPLPIERMLLGARRSIERPVLSTSLRPQPTAPALGPDRRSPTSHYYRTLLWYLFPRWSFLSRKPCHDQPRWISCLLRLASSWQLQHVYFVSSLLRSLPARGGYQRVRLLQVRHCPLS